MQQSNTTVPDFATLLNRFCQRSNLNLKELAERSNLSFNTIRNWSRRTARPRSWEDVVKLAQVLALTRHELDQLLAATDHPSVAQLLNRHPKKLAGLGWSRDEPKLDEADELLGDMREEPLLVAHEPLVSRIRRRLARFSSLLRFWPLVLALLLGGAAGSAVTHALVPRMPDVYIKYPPPQFSNSVWQLLDKRIDITPSYTGPHAITWVKVAEKVNFSFRIINTWDKVATLPEMGLPMRGPDGCKDWAGQRIGGPSVRAITAMPNEGYTYSADVVFSEPGIYFVEPLTNNEHGTRANWLETRHWFVVANADGSLPDLQCMSLGTPTPRP